MRYEVTEEENLNLTTLATMDELKSAIWAMNKEKAPGPDGFNVFFF